MRTNHGGCDMTHACSEEACTQPGTQLAGTRGGADLLFCAYSFPSTFSGRKFGGDGGDLHGVS